MSEEHLLELDDISKFYGNIIALKGVSTFVNAGEVTCVLGDNGAGKSTFIKILAGVHKQTEGSIRMNGQEVSFDSPRDALASGIATVYQDLAMVPLMSVWRSPWPTWSRSTGSATDPSWARPPSRSSARPT